MFCRKCGEQISDDSEFCPVCGENQGITMSTEETEKSGNGVGKIAGTVAKAAVTIVIAGLSAASEEAGKGLQEAVQRGTANILKGMGLKKKTLFDIGGEAFKRQRKYFKKRVRKWRW